MLSSLRAMILTCACAGTFVFGVGCSQGEGDRCEVDSDCKGGLICAPTGSTHNGVCRSKSSPGTGGTGGGVGQDAAIPVSHLDAAGDSSVIAADAGSDGSALAVDLAVGTTDAVDDGPAVPTDAAASVDGVVTVGGDASPDAEAADGPAATD